jgi:hypothetical protein
MKSLEIIASHEFRLGLNDEIWSGAEQGNQLNSLYRHPKILI